MSVINRRLELVSQKIREWHAHELGFKKSERLRRFRYRVGRWVLMLYHQFIADDVRIRSESLTFLMAFSLLPLTAGAFFIFTLFSQFGMVQEALHSGLSGFLNTIPEEHREFVQDYVLKFKDAYLQAMEKKSSSLGIFALLFLVWVGLKFYANIERTLNHIWSADRERSFLEQLRNFMVVTVAAPIVIIAGLSLPLILHNLPGTRYVLAEIPLLSALLSDIVPAGLIFLTFMALYHYVPVRRVKWQSAMAGAIFATVLLELTNSGMRIYFKFGTNTAYGKLAVVPLVGFWTYLTWIVVILGAELSYLMQNQSEILAASPLEPTLREGESLLTILHELHQAFRQARNPVGFEDLLFLTALKSSRLRLVIKYLLRKKLILECSHDGLRLEGYYVLAQDLAELPIPQLLADFYGAGDLRIGAANPLAIQWAESVRRWTESFQPLSLT